MIVVDTNVLVYYLVEGKFTGAAEAIRKADDEWCVPVICFSELSNTLVQLMKHNQITRDQADALLGEADRLLQGKMYRVRPEQVLRLAEESGCSAYDCEFVALAQQLGVSLVTKDKQVLKDFPKVAQSLK